MFLISYLYMLSILYKSNICNDESNIKKNIKFLIISSLSYLLIYMANKKLKLNNKYLIGLGLIDIILLFYLYNNQQNNKKIEDNDETIFNEKIKNISMEIQKLDKEFKDIEDNTPNVNIPLYKTQDVPIPIYKS